MKQKEQLKNLLVQRGYAETLPEAERMILAAQVKVDDVVLTQAGAKVSSEARLEVRGDRKYVSRGGLKLEGALEDFSFDPSGLTCIDAGASTGGFTDCLLKRGAAQVTAVDVGYGQFDWKLRSDSRVILFERTNIATATPASLGAPFDVLVADLSFTSLARLAVQLAAFTGEGGNSFTLVKPQFELPKDVVKDGVIRSFDLHVQALEMVVESYQSNRMAVQGLSFSHLLGPKGNREFWIWAVKGGTTATIDAREVVRRSHEELA